MNIEPFNFKKTSGRKPIKDRGIKWEEKYIEKSLSLKKKFDKAVGPGTYYRWEGHDITTNSDYYVVVGPSLQRGVGKMFFAGIKRLPPAAERKFKKVYSPYGEYFPTIKGALSYASRKWGVRMPPHAPNYTRQHLAPVNISEHIKA